MKKKKHTNEKWCNVKKNVTNTKRKKKKESTNIMTQAAHGNVNAYVFYGNSSGIVPRALDLLPVLPLSSCRSFYSSLQISVFQGSNSKILG